MLAPSDTTYATYSVDSCRRSHSLSIIYCVSLKTGT